MPFEFINNTTIDPKARKLIRSHAAKGKNVGRKLSRPSRQKIAPWRYKAIEITANLETKPMACSSTTVELPSPINETNLPLFRLERQIGDELSLILFPFEATPSARILVQRVLSFIGSVYAPLEVCTTISFEPINRHFMAENILRDEACFYCTAAMSLVALNSRPQDREAFRLVAFTFRLLNSKLMGDDALKDPTMAAVVAMTQYERLRREYHKALIHLKGVQRMVELQGGISLLTKRQPGLAQKIFRADLEIALYLGSVTIFQAEDVPGHDTISWLRKRFWKTHSHQFVDSGLSRTLDTSLQDVLVDISSLAWMLNGHLGQEPQLTGYIFHDVLLLFGYRLLHINSVYGSRPVSWLGDILQASLMVFISSFLVGLGGISPDFPPLSQLARSVAHTYPGANEENQEVYLWALFIGSAAIFSQQDDIWLLPRIQQTAFLLDLHDWENVSGILSKFPWVKVLHDKPAQAVWNRSVSLHI